MKTRNGRPASSDDVTARRTARRARARATTAMEDVESRLDRGLMGTSNEDTSVDEVAMLTSRPGLSERALRFISEQRRFMRRDVLMNLVVNPGTPRATALKLMKALTPRELTHILQCPFAPKVVLNAIRKRLDAHQG